MTDHIIKLIEYALSKTDGFTCDEWEAETDRLHHTASARVNELMNAKVIIRTRDTRITRSGSKAHVFRIDPEIGSVKDGHSRFLKWKDGHKRFLKQARESLTDQLTEQIKKNQKTVTVEREFMMAIHMGIDMFMTKGHHDTCGKALGNYHCNCGFDILGKCVKTLETL